MQRLWTIALTAAATLCLACSEATPPSESDGSGGNAGAGGNDSTWSGGRLGSFSIGLVRPSDDSPGHTSLLGVVYRSPYPYETTWRLEREDGECRLLVPTSPFCDPMCASGTTCVESGECVRKPTLANVGTVTVRGLRTASGATEFKMMPVANNYQPGGGVGPLPYPAFAAGDPIRIEASGGELQPFTLLGRGIDPLDLTSPTPVRVAPDEAITVTWVPSSVPDAGTVHVKLDISHHGGQKGVIECASEDVGALTISASLVTSLLDLGYAGFPSIVVSRISRAETTIAAGTIDLVIESAVESAVEIPGLVSCTSDDDCETGQTCSDARRCE